MKVPAITKYARKIAASRIVWTVTALLVLYTLGGFVLAPWLVERYVPRYAEDTLGQRATFDNVRINPFLLTFEATGFRLEGPGEQPTLAFERLYADFELSSIVNRAWTFSEVRLSGGALGLEIDREGRFNLAELAARLRDPDEPAGEPPRLIVERLVVEDSSVSLIDLSGTQRAAAVLAPVDLELTGLSTLAERRTRYTLNAQLRESATTLSAQGEAVLQPLALEGELALRGLDLATVWPFFRDALGVAEPKGALALSGHYAYSAERDGGLVLREVTAALADFVLNPRGGDPLLALRSVALEGGTVDFGARTVGMAALRLSGGLAGVRFDEEGRVDWQGIAGNQDSEKAAEPPSRPGAPWQIDIAKGTIDKVAFEYADRNRPAALKARAEALDAELALAVTAGGGATRVLIDNLQGQLTDTRLTVDVPDAEPVTLSLFRVEGGRLDTAAREIAARSIALRGASVALARDASGPQGLMKALTPQGGPSADAAPAADPWRVALNEVAFDTLALRYSDASLTPPITARARELKGRFQFDSGANGTTGVLAQAIDLEAGALTVTTSGTDTPLATLDTFTLEGGRIDTGERYAGARRIALAGGGTHLTRGPDGPTGVLALFARTGERAPAAKSAGPATDWRYRVDTVSVERYRLDLADRGLRPELRYDVELTSATLENIDSTATKPIAVKAALRIGTDGTLKGNGTIAQSFGAANADVEAAAVPLAPLQPLLATYATLELKSGTLSATAKLRYGAGEGPLLTARGTASIAGFLVNETQSGERFLSWKRLTAEGLTFTLGPNELLISELRATEPGMKLLIAKDRSVNLTGVFRDRGPSAADGKPPMPVRIERIRLENGTLDFADLSLVLPFSTRVHDLSGAIVGASTDPDARARVEIAGRIQDYGEASAVGSLIPLRPTEFLDVEVRFENVAVPALSPYTATFAGRTIEAGRLWLTLQYKIADTKLAGENTIVLEDFKLGERVSAPNALDLPLDLAVALLKGPDGRIKLTVPVTGDVDNPEFDYGKVIRSAIASAIGRVITAPFRMLASLFGSAESEELQRVVFEPGSERISPPQRERLDRLAEALKARPQLKLVVRGPYDPGEDGEALKRALVRQKLAAALGERREGGAAPGPITYGSADTQKALEAMLAEAEPGAIEALASRYAERQGRPAQRVNPILGTFGRGSTDTAFYEAAFERLVELQSLPDTAVRLLAVGRAQAMMDALAQKGVSAERLQTGSITPVEAGKEGRIEAEFALETM